MIVLNPPVARIAACLLLPFACAQPGLSQDVPAADLVIHSAKIVTIDPAYPRAQAIAFQGEKILAVTTDEAITRYVREGRTEVIDAQGRLVVPGFNDAHVHFGPIDLDYIDLRYTTDPAVITRKVKEAVAKAKPGELIRGGQWEHEMFRGRQQGNAQRRVSGRCRGLPRGSVHAAARAHHVREGGLYHRRRQSRLPSQ